MPPVSPVQQPPRVFLGIDPGASGGLAAVDNLGLMACPAMSMPSTEADIWSWFNGFQMNIQEGLRSHAVIELNTGYVGGAGNPGSSMFKFGRGTGVLIGCLVAAAVPYEEVTPGTWQRALGIPGRKRTEAKGRFKNRLKAKAQQLFPSVKVTLATADALLIAEFCRRKHLGLLTGKSS